MHLNLSSKKWQPFVSNLRVKMTAARFCLLANKLLRQQIEVNYSSILNLISQGPTNIMVQTCFFFHSINHKICTVFCNFTCWMVLHRKKYHQQISIINISLFVFWKFLIFWKVVIWISLSDVHRYTLSLIWCWSGLWWPWPHFNTKNILYGVRFSYS